MIFPIWANVCSKKVKKKHSGWKSLKLSPFVILENYQVPTFSNQSRNVFQFLPFPDFEYLGEFLDNLREIWDF